MNYKKLHKDTITKLQEMVNSGKITVEIARGICADFVPESEDERIRKEIISALKYSNYNGVYYKHLAWLEKQGEQKPNFCHHEVDLSGCSEEYRKAYYDGWNNCNQQHVQLEAEQSPTDKVEPKFHEGDWIIHHGTENIYQVVAVIDNQYQLKYGDTYTVQKCADVDRCARLWDITKDAKDGDVLFQDLMDGKTFIFDGINPEMAILYSFIISNDGKDVLPYHIGKPNTGIGNIEENKNIIHPATKEQCDTLFAKMKEAGYEWDAEQNKLKKIKQKPAIKIELDDNGEPVLTPFEAELFSMMSEAWQCYSFGEEVNIAKIVKEHSIELLERVNKQKPAWSEEDEKMMAVIEHHLNDWGSSITSILWLKSLKDRVQPNQEWSEEDDAKRKTAILFLYNYDHIADVRDCINWLKSLIPHNTWKPSDEQIKVCKEVYADILSAKGFDLGTVISELNRLEEELKKLKG